MEQRDPPFRPSMRRARTRKRSYSQIMVSPDDAAVQLTVEQGVHQER